MEADPSIANSLGNRPDDALLDRYLAGEVTPDERAAVYAWVSADSKREVLLNSLLTPGNVPEAGDLSRETALEWTARILETEHSITAISQKARWGNSFSSGILRGWVKDTEAEQGISGFSNGALRLKRWGTWAIGIGALSLTVITIKYISSEAPAPQAKTYITANAKRLRATLPDGSIITLAPATKVRYASTNDTRNVEVDGEAYFEVQHNNRTSFNVQVAGITTRVLGTRFVVRKYNSDATVRVVVTDGRVSVSRAGVLNAGDLAKVSLAGEVSITRNTAVASYMDWVNGKSTYVNVPLREIVPELERAYDLSITISDPETGELPVTTTLATTIRPGEILNAIASSLGARVTRTGRSVTFSAR